MPNGKVKAEIKCKKLKFTWFFTQIHQAEYKGDSRSYVEANFSFESSSTQSPAEFFIYTSNPNDPKINSVELTSPNGVKYTTQLSDLHDINVIKIDALINEVCGWFTFTLSNSKIGS